MRASICSTSQLDSIRHAPGVVHVRSLVRLRSSLLWLSGRILLSALRRAPAAGAAGAAGAAVAAGAAAAARNAVAADKGHEHLHHRCPNHQCIGRHRFNHHDHHHQGLRDTPPCHDDHAPPRGQEGPSSAQSSTPSASQVPTCKLGPSGARMVSIGSLALVQRPRQEAPSYSCSRSPGPRWSRCNFNWDRKDVLGLKMEGRRSKKKCMSHPRCKWETVEEKPEIFIVQAMPAKCHFAFVCHKPVGERLVHVAFQNIGLSCQ